MKYLYAVIAIIIVIGIFSTIIQALGPESAGGNIASVLMGLSAVFVVGWILRKR